MKAQQKLKQVVPAPELINSTELALYEQLALKRLRWLLLRQRLKRLTGILRGGLAHLFRLFGPTEVLRAVEPRRPALRRHEWEHREPWQGPRLL